MHEAPTCSEALRPLVAAAEGIASIPSGSRDLCGARHIAKRPVGAYNNITEPCHIVLQGGACCQDGVKLAGRRTLLMRYARQSVRQLDGAPCTATPVQHQPWNMLLMYRDRNCCLDGQPWPSKASPLPCRRAPGLGLLTDMYMYDSHPDWHPDSNLHQMARQRHLELELLLSGVAQVVQGRAHRRVHGQRAAAQDDGALPGGRQVLPQHLLRNEPRAALPPCGRRKKLRYPLKTSTSNTAPAHAEVRCGEGYSRKT